MIKRMSLSLTIVSTLLVSLCIASAQDRDQPDLTISPAIRSEVIEGALKKLNDFYVFPETAKKMEQAIRDRVLRKEYDQITSARTLATTLQSHLQEVSHDKHLRVMFSAEPLPPEREGDRQPSPEEQARQIEFLRTINFGFEKVERLPGNVGYLDLRGFLPAQFGADTVVAAMNLLANTDALIIDVRRNGGGDPAMVALISSYLFDGEPVHLNDLYFRPNDSTRQWWTLPYVPGKRYGGKKEVYVLTSNRTFSAAEEFTYNLKSLKRATIVGETTGGGAHPGGPRRINDHFGIWVPSGRAINPITKTNWEGTGVKPDIDVPADQALKVAHIAAMKKVLEKVTEPERKDAISQAITNIQKELDEMKQGPKRNP
ncbi:MAG TPA: S41 family peptidase [Blastocatellia bacterium]|nr:S41 family peptidase [Blastocatellia bacterium]